MISYFFWQCRVWICCRRVRYWQTVIAGQRRIWGHSHPKDSERFLRAMQDRSKARERLARVFDVAQ